MFPLFICIIVYAFVSFPPRATLFAPPPPPGNQQTSRPVRKLCHDARSQGGVGGVVRPLPPPPCKLKVHILAIPYLRLLTNFTKTLVQRFETMNTHCDCFVFCKVLDVSSRITIVRPTGLKNYQTI